MKKPLKKPPKKRSQTRAKKRVKTRQASQKAEGGYYHLPARTEAEQFRDLPEDLQDAWARLREALHALGDQEVRTSHRAIMFARKTCYAFVRPKKKYLELVVFLRDAVDSELVKKVDAVSKTKFSHVIPVTHRDQVEAPITEWLACAFEQAG